MKERRECGGEREVNSRKIRPERVLAFVPSILPYFPFFPVFSGYKTSGHCTEFKARVEEGMFTIWTKPIHFFSAATAMDVLNLNQECHCAVLTSTEKCLSKYRIINFIMSHTSCLQYV